MSKYSDISLISSPIQNHADILAKQIATKTKFELKKPMYILLVLLHKRWLSMKCDKMLNNYFKEYVEYYSTKQSVNNEESKYKSILDKEFPYKKDHSIANQNDNEYIKNLLNNKNDIIKNLKEEINEFHSDIPIISNCVVNLDIANKDKKWSKRETKLYQELFNNKPKNFDFIASGIGTKSVHECIDFYYRNRKKNPKIFKREKRKLKKSPKISSTSIKSNNDSYQSSVPKYSSNIDSSKLAKSTPNYYPMVTKTPPQIQSIPTNQPPPLQPVQYNPELIDHEYILPQDIKLNEKWKLYVFLYL